MLTALGAVALGALVGLVLGALGGGGSILTVPALVLVLGLPAQEATTASLVIVGVTSAAAAAAHARGGRTRWRTAATLAVVGAPGALLGTRLNRAVDPDVLLLGFSALMLLAAAGMLALDRGADDEPVEGGGAGVATRVRSRWRTALRIAGAGAGIGLLTGFFGVGGGFVVVPVLVVLLGLTMPAAVGTSLVVIALNSAVSLASRVDQPDWSWSVIVPFTLAAVALSLLGRRIAGRVDAATLTRAFAVLLVLVAVWVAVRALIGTG